ncbi:ABC-three component system middle component 6 [Lacticaseibacillus chiayiensis]|uniref:ABC-three component system middle component 6 n=1 Tax=Lacticaseibacillus chiayiensis TaxID=2100821 RepID=UPI003C78B896
MILPTDTRPELSLYFIGAKLLGVLKTFEDGRGSFFDVYRALQEEVDVSLKLYQLTLDWLFLINAAVINSEGEVRLVHQQT